MYSEASVSGPHNSAPLSKWPARLNYAQMYRGRAPVMSPPHRQIHESSDSSESASALCSLSSSLRCRCVHHPVYWCSSSSGFAYTACVYIDATQGTLIRTISRTILIRRAQSRDESTMGLQYNANKRSVSWFVRSKIGVLGLLRMCAWRLWDGDILQEALRLLGQYLHRLGRSYP